MRAIRRAGGVYDDEFELTAGNIARQRYGYESRAAGGEIIQQRVNGDVAFAPALREYAVFENGQRQGAESHLLEANVVDGAADDAGGRDSFGRADVVAGKAFERGADGIVFRGLRR